MVHYKKIIKAKTNQKIFKQIYERVFYDGNKPKVRMWLVKRGVSYNKLDEVESMMRVTFTNAIFEYTHGKINFEKYVWVKFDQCLSNYNFRNNNIKKIKDLFLYDDVVDGNVYNIGYLSDDLYFDTENIMKCMTWMQSYIFKCKLHNDWNDSEIYEYMNKFIKISPDDFMNEVESIKQIIISYLDGEL